MTLDLVGQVEKRGGIIRDKRLEFCKLKLLFCAEHPSTWVHRGERKVLVVEGKSGAGEFRGSSSEVTGRR